jgi:hypothetical protein
VGVGIGVRGDGLGIGILCVRIAVGLIGISGVDIIRLSF